MTRGRDPEHGSPSHRLIASSSCSIAVPSSLATTHPTLTVTRCLVLRALNKLATAVASLSVLRTLHAKTCVCLGAQHVLAGRPDDSSHGRPVDLSPPVLHRLQGRRSPPSKLATHDKLAPSLPPTPYFPPPSIPPPPAPPSPLAPHPMRLPRAALRAGRAANSGNLSAEITRESLRGDLPPISETF